MNNDDICIKINNGDKFGEWTVVEYNATRSLCQCSCGKTKLVSNFDLTHHKSSSCGHIRKKFNIYEGAEFGEWTAIHKTQNYKWLFRCSCGVEKELPINLVASGRSKSCGHSTTGFRDLKGQQFGELKVLEYTKEQGWKCQCSCGKIVYQPGYMLINHKVSTCGHSKFTKDTTRLVGKKFGMLEVLEYAGNYSWLCKCQCGNTKVILEANLLNGTTISCGCYTTKKSKDELIEIIDKFNMDNNRAPFINDLAKLLNLSYGYTSKLISSYDLNSRLNKSFGSYLEYIVYNKIAKYGYSIELHNKRLIAPYELDLYIDELKLVIEINGNYYHNDYIIDSMYHQNKTIACAKKGIRLIHIFEYEINNNNDKIDMYLDNIFNRNKNVIYARKTYIKQIEYDEANKFIDSNHLQGNANASVYLGCINSENNEILGVMSLGTPRFNNGYQYEIIRLCWKENINVVGGAEKIFKYFVDTYNPESILTYVDISKFTGNVYTRLGFKPTKECFTQPSYIWWNSDKDIVLQRYQTQKKHLVEIGIAKENDTEDSAMRHHNFYKIYNCGNLKLEWYKQ